MGLALRDAPLARRVQVAPGELSRTTEGVSQRIYSLPPLAAWVSLHESWIKNTDTKNPAMFMDTRVSWVCFTKTAYFCG
jgi:hypothetical protein